MSFSSNKDAKFDREYRERSRERRERKRSQESRERKGSREGRKVPSVIPHFVEPVPVPVFYMVRKSLNTILYV